jgi:hypothetical protein
LTLDWVGSFSTPFKGAPLAALLGATFGTKTGAAEAAESAEPHALLISFCLVRESVCFRLTIINTIFP